VAAGPWRRTSTARGRRGRLIGATPERPQGAATGAGAAALSGALVGLCVGIALL
jgi:hypothetical protein